MIYHWLFKITYLQTPHSQIVQRIALVLKTVPLLSLTIVEIIAVTTLPLTTTTTTVVMVTMALTGVLVGLGLVVMGDRGIPLLGR